MQQREIQAKPEQQPPGGEDGLSASGHLSQRATVLQGTELGDDSSHRRLRLLEVQLSQPFHRDV